MKDNESPLPVTVSDRSAPSLMEFVARSIWIEKIIVDHLNIGEAASTCDFNQLVLASLAFQVQLNLLWRRSTAECLALSLRTNHGTRRNPDAAEAPR